LRAEGGPDSWHPVVSHASVSPVGAEACSQRPFGVLEGAGAGAVRWYGGQLAWAHQSRNDDKSLGKSGRGNRHRHRPP